MPDTRIRSQRGRNPASFNDYALRLASSVGLTLALGVLWALLHRYQGLGGDAELYAVQALAHIHPTLLSDIYLQNENQDRFTVFSPLYAGCIQLFGLLPAALILAILCTISTFLATWSLARSMVDREAAWLAVAFVIIAASGYGAYRVFRYLEDWLTARNLAVALVIGALALHLHGRRRLGLLMAFCACFVHPLMALPGLLVLACLWVPPRVGVLGAIAGILCVFGLGGLLEVHPLTTGPFELIDGEWLYVVKERSQFLFLQLWKWSDWETNIRPFACLTLTALSMSEPKVRHLCIAGMLVGATGLAVALIASLIGPVAILLQGQAWRWEWITCFLSILLLLPTALRMWGDPKCGPICAMLLVLGWTYAPVDGLGCIGAAIMLWTIRELINERSARLLRWGAALLGLVIVGWLVSNCWTIVSAPLTAADPSHLGITRIRNMMGLHVSAVLLCWLFVRLTHSASSAVIVGLLAIAITFAAVKVLPGSLAFKGRDGSVAAIREFADWRKVIPPSSTVYVAGRQATGFSWFTLERPSYLTEDQSAGVVFSRANAHEIVRRSRILLPLEDPSWQILDRNSAIDSAGGSPPPARTLTVPSLNGICSDSALDFVVARPSLDVPHLTHTAQGPYFEWNLYDCRALRDRHPAA